MSLQYKIFNLLREVITLL